MNGAGEAVDLYISGPVSRLSLNILKSLQKDRPWLCLSRCYPPPLSNEWCKLQRRPARLLTCTCCLDSVARRHQPRQH